MRKFLILSLVFVFSVRVYTQNSTLPDVVSKAFEQKYPKAKKVKWSSENIDDFQAEFALDSLNCTAVFSNKGVWQQTGIDVPPPILLASIHALIKKNYPKSKITRASKISTSKNKTYYEIELRKNEELEYIYFDEAGNELSSLK